MNDDPIDIDAGLECAIERVLGRDDRPDDWALLRGRAAGDPALWDRLVDALHDDAVLRASVGAALPAGAELPVAVGVATDSIAAGSNAGGGAARVRRAGGRAAFALAAAAVVAWLAGVPSPLASLRVQHGSSMRPPATVPAAGTGRSASPDPAGPLAAGLGQLPDVVLATEPRSDGGFDVVVLRRRVERCSGDGLQILRHDEQGQPFVAPLRAVSAMPARVSSY